MGSQAVPGGASTLTRKYAHPTATGFDHSELHSGKLLLESPGRMPFIGSRETTTTTKQLHPKTSQNIFGFETIDPEGSITTQPRIYVCIYIPTEKKDDCSCCWLSHQTLRMALAHWAPLLSRILWVPAVGSQPFRSVWTCCMSGTGADPW